MFPQEDEGPWMDNGTSNPGQQRYLETPGLNCHVPPHNLVSGDTGKLRKLEGAKRGVLAVRALFAKDL